MKKMLSSNLARVNMHLYNQESILRHYGGGYSCISKTTSLKLRRALDQEDIEIQEDGVPIIL